MTPSLFPKIIARLQIVVLVQRVQGFFQVQGHTPDWLHDFFPEVVADISQNLMASTFPFLGDFLIDAQFSWKNNPTEILESGWWVECNKNGEEIPLKASALLIDDKKILIIHYSQTAYSQRQKLLLTAREKALSKHKERKKIEREIQQDNYFDRLSSLPSQILLRSNSIQELEDLKQREDRSFDIYMLDIEQLMSVNKRYGKAFGDLILMQITKRIKRNLSVDDFLVRGVEEDLIVITFSEGLKSDYQPFAEKMLRDLMRPYWLGDDEVVLKFNLGIAQGTNFQIQLETVLNQASIAMEYTKNDCPQLYALYEPAIEQRMVRQSNLERDLPQSIRKKQLQIYYEPIVSLNKRGISGFEALVRWQHPTYGLVPPMDFIPFAEQSGFIVPMGEWVLSQAWNQVAQWNSNLANAIVVQVNLSARQLADPSLVETINALMKWGYLSPQCLNLEITESMVHDNLEIAVDQLKKIKALGVHISMDDFGTGYSSLNCLHRLPIDTLKIDRSLIQETSAHSTEILRAMVNLAHNLELVVIAEGVETESQLAWVQSLNCDYAQGYLFSRPVPPRQAHQLLLQPLQAFTNTEISLPTEGLK